MKTESKQTSTRIFTKEYSGIVNSIVTDSILSPFGEPEEIADKRYKVKALWDTGSCGLINRSLAKKLGFIPAGTKKHYYKGGYEDCYYYEAYVNPGNGIFIPVQLMETKYENPFSPPLAIGMDIIRKGDFFINQKITGTVMTFTLPVEEHQESIPEFESFEDYTERNDDTLKMIYDDDPCLIVGYSEIMDYLPFKCSISKSNKTTDVRAIWDTGAVRSMITKSLARRLNLKPTGYYGASSFNQAHRVPCLQIEINLTDNNSYSVNVGIQDEDEREDLIIGMDVISQGNFLLKNLNQEAELTFEKLHTMVKERINPYVQN